MAEITPRNLVTVDFAVREHRSLWLDAWRRLISSKTARLGMFIVYCLFLSATLAHFFWTYEAKDRLELLPSS